MGKRILIIDDSEDMLEMLNIVFQDTGLEVILSTTGMTSGEIEVICPDLVLLDVEIRGYKTTGDKICKEIKSNPMLSDITVFLVSGEDNLPGISKSCNADGWFSKPFDIWKFKSAVMQRL